MWCEVRAAVGSRCHCCQAASSLAGTAVLAAESDKNASSCGVIAHGRKPQINITTLRYVKVTVTSGGDSIYMDNHHEEQWGLKLKHS
jgi:hypothetical protein